MTSPHDGGTSSDHHQAMSIGEHLEELRWHVLRAVGWVALAAVVSLSFQETLMWIATKPHIDVATALQEEKPLEKAPAELRDRLGAIRSRGKEVAARLDDLARGEAELRLQVEPPEQRLDALEREQEDLLARAQALASRLGELRSKSDLSPEDLAALRTEREALLVEQGHLAEGVARDVEPFVDRRARIPQIRLTQLRYQEAFLSSLKLALLAALFLASPLSLWELWKFVAKGLYPHEKRYVSLFYPLSLLAFALGMCFGYFVLIPLGLKFLITYGSPDLIEGGIALEDYLSLFTGLTLVVGAIFELPLVMTFLSLVGLVGPAKFRAIRRYWILAAFIIGALLTPPDPVTQTLMAIPLLGLYEVGILLAGLVAKETAREEDPRLQPPPAARRPAPGPERPLSPQEESAANYPERPLTPEERGAARALDLPAPVGERVARGAPPPAPDPDPALAQGTRFDPSREVEDQLDDGPQERGGQEPATDDAPAPAGDADEAAAVPAASDSGEAAPPPS